MSKEMNVRILHVTKTTAEWAAETATIAKGLLCIEFTTDGKTLAKVGDGTSAYSGLKYITDGAFNIADYSTTEQMNTSISDAISKLGNILTFKGIKATAGELPTTDNAVGDVWFVGTAGETTDSYSEYIWTSDNKWEFVGRVQTEVDLSGYATVATVNGIDGRVTTLEGASHTHTNADVLAATTASFTTEEKTKLAGLENYDDTDVTKAIDDVADRVTDLEGTSHTHTNADVLNATTASFTTEEKTKLAGLENYDDTALAGRVTDVENGKVDKVEGKGLSTEDYTTAEKEKLASLSNYDDTALSESVTGLTTKVTTLEGKAHTHTNAAILDATTASFTAEDKTKLDSLSNYDDTALAGRVTAVENGKVDKVEGKGLSTNDYTTEEKTKLAGLENYDDTALAGRVTDLETDSHTHANADVLNATTASYTTEEKTKLAGLENYDDTALAKRVSDIEADYLKSTDTLVLNCTL